MGALDGLSVVLDAQPIENLHNWSEVDRVKHAHAGVVHAFGLLWSGLGLYVANLGSKFVG
jgi:hypothetical protein